jgi:hypothetical protein
MRGFFRAVTAGALAFAAFMVVDFIPQSGVLEAASASETERLESSSEILVVNATGLSVDVYVNYETQPTVSDPKPLIGEFANGDELNSTVLAVNGTTARPYGVYTFSVRPKGQPDAELLGAASVVLEQGRSFAGVFHEAPGGGHQFSIYESDLSPAANARLTVRNTTSERASWRIAPNGEAPQIPPDERSGTLGPGEWQIARDVTDNDYVIEFFVGGERVGMYPDLDLAAAKNFVVYLIGQPQPTDDEVLLQRPVAFEELEVEPGEPEPDVVTPAAPPLSVTDTNAPIEFSCPAVSVWETNTRGSAITALDPDGLVTNLSIDSVDPHVGGIEIRSQSLSPSTAIGEPASARVRFKGDIPSGSYQVRIAANRGSLAQQAGCAMQLTVRPITIQRLLGQVRRYRESGDIEDRVGENLRLMLVSARRWLNDGYIDQACLDLRRVITQIGSEKGKAISDVAADALAGETKALSADLGCG